MNKNITSFYVAVKDNHVIAFESNLSDFIANFLKIEPSARNYQFYYRKFQKEPYFEWHGYYFQKLI